MLANILIASNWTVIRHSEHFTESGMKDHKWIPLIAALADHAIISSDKSMKLWEAEDGRVRPAIEQACAKIFFLKGAGKTLPEQAHAIEQARANICRCFRRYANTYFIGRIHSGNRLGEVETICCGTRKSKAAREGVA